MGVYDFMNNLELFNQAVLELAHRDESLLKRVESIKSLIDEVDSSKLPFAGEITFKNIQTGLKNLHKDNAYQIVNMTVGLFSDIRADSILHPEKYN